MRLREWQDANGKKVSTGSSTQVVNNPASTSTPATRTLKRSYKEKFKKLLDYASKHRDPSVTRAEIKKITDDEFHYMEHYNDKISGEYDLDIVVAVSLYKGNWVMYIYKDGEKMITETGDDYQSLLKELKDYISIPSVLTPEYADLFEWVDAKGNKVSNTASPASTATTSSVSFKKRLNKLINYYGQHHPAEIDFITVNLLTNDTLDFTEFYDDRSSVVYNIYIGPTTEAWRLKITVQGKLKDDIAGQGWVDLLKTLRPYITVPVTTTPEYEDLLTESLTESIEAIPEKLYHATYKQFLKSIQQKGLGNTKRKMWSDSVSGVVYLADDPWVAESYAEESEWLDEVEDPDEYLDNIIIIEIDVSKLDSNKLFIDSNVLLDEGEENSTWEYHGIIPWEACKIFNSSIAEDFKLYENLWENI